MKVNLRALNNSISENHVMLPNNSHTCKYKRARIYLYLLYSGPRLRPRGRMTKFPSQSKVALLQPLCSRCIVYSASSFMSLAGGGPVISVFKHFSHISLSKNIYLYQCVLKTLQSVSTNVVYVSVATISCIALLIYYWSIRQYTYNVTMGHVRYNCCRQNARIHIVLFPHYRINGMITVFPIITGITIIIIIIIIIMIIIVITNYYYCQTRWPCCLRVKTHIQRSGQQLVI